MADGLVSEMVAFQNGLLNEFKCITGTHDDIAMDFMEQSNWNLDQAINSFFDDDSSPGVACGINEDPILVSDSPEKPVDSNNSDSQSLIEDSSNLKLLTWNVDGLDERNLSERTKAVINFIKTWKPDVVYLQEVVPETWPEYQRLCRGYTCLHGMDCQMYKYFNTILYNNTTIKPSGAKDCINFRSSNMGRHLLIQPALYKDKTQLILMSSHLESTAGGKEERKKQLHQVFERISKQSPDVTVLFGGDTNLRDVEVSSVGGLPPGVLDVWEECGKEMATKFTWDVSVNDNLDWSFPNKPKLRFDRVFTRPGNNQNILLPASFSLVGKERLLSCHRFPSDHWGIWCEFAPN